jgi:hypothetical protein
MIMPPRLRKAVLTAHITTSLGWLGAVAAYIALDIAAATSQDVQTARGAYLAMEVTVWYVIVPLALASLLIGVVNSLGTPWGLFRHYWVLVKLLLTLFATTVLLIETQTVSYLAEAAASGADPRELPGTLLHSVGGLVVLLIIAILSVFKPRGMTRHGWRKQQEQRRQQREQRRVPVP